MNAYTPQSFNLQIFRSLNSCAWSSIVNACTNSSQRDYENIISRVSVPSQPRRDTIGCRKNELTSVDCRLCAKYWVIFHVFHHKKATHGIHTFMGRVHSMTKRYFFFPLKKHLVVISVSTMHDKCLSQKKHRWSLGREAERNVFSPNIWKKKKKHNILLFNMCKHLWFGSQRENLIISNLGLEMIYPKKNWFSKKSISVAPTAMASV